MAPLERKQNMNRKNRKFGIWVVAVATALSLTACSGGNAEPAAEQPTQVAPAPAPEAAATDESEVDAATVQACLDMSGPFADAASKMLEAADGSADPQEVVDAYTALADALGEIAASSSSPEVEAAAAAAQVDMTAVRDALQKVYVENDMSALGDLTAATTAMQESYQALLGLCSA